MGGLWVGLVAPALAFDAPLFLAGVDGAVRELAVVCTRCAITPRALLRCKVRACIFLFNCGLFLGLLTFVVASVETAYQLWLMLLALYRARQITYQYLCKFVPTSELYLNLFSDTCLSLCSRVSMHWR